MQVVRQASEGVFVPLTVGGGIREFTDADGKHWSALEVASEYFRSGADKVSIGGDAVLAAEEYRRTGKKTGGSSIEQISWVSLLPALYSGMSGHCMFCHRVQVSSRHCNTVSHWCHMGCFKSHCKQHEWPYFCVQHKVVYKLVLSRIVVWP